MRLHLDTGMNGSGVSGAAETTQTAAALKASTGRQRTSAGGDSSQISGTSVLLNQMASSHAERVQQLTQLVQAGSYNVPGAKVARAVVAHAGKGGD